MATAIKEFDPTIEVTFLVRNYTEPIARLAPDIDHLSLYDPKASTVERINVFKNTKADIYFFPAPRPELVLAARMAGFKRRVGTGYRWYSPLFSDKIFEHRKTAEYHEADYNVHMLRPIGLNQQIAPPTKLVLPLNLQHTLDEKLVTLLPPGETKFAILHITTNGSTVTWPIERFIELGKWVAHELTLPIVLTGLGSDRETLLSAAEAMKQAGADVMLFVDRPLLELAGLLARAEIVVSNSTGPGHLAAALGTRTLGLFPLSRALSKERWGFRGKRVLNLSPISGSKSSCPMCKDCTCMQHVSVEEAAGALKELMKN